MTVGPVLGGHLGTHALAALPGQWVCQAHHSGAGAEPSRVTWEGFPRLYGGLPPAQTRLTGAGRTRDSNGRRAR